MNAYALQQQVRNGSLSNNPTSSALSPPIRSPPTQPSKNEYSPYNPNLSISSGPSNQQPEPNIVVPAAPPPAPPAATAGKESTNGKKRGRANLASGVAGRSPEPNTIEDGDDEETKARKRRLALSCSECKRRKIKCDRKQPCSSCIRRKVPHSCSWDDGDDQQQSFALNSDLRHLARRLAHLESLFQTTNPDLLPKDGPIPLTSSQRISPDSPSFSPHSRNGVNGDEVMNEDETLQRSFSDTEDAANNLEDVAFGARVPVLRAVTTVGGGSGGGGGGQTYSNSASSSRTRGGAGRRGGELTRALTSILAEPLSFDQDGRPRSAVRLGLDLAISSSDLPRIRSGSMAQIFAVLPGKEIADFLLAKYFTEMDWDYQPLDAEAFVAEHERYREMQMDGREDSVDPLWVAVFCMVLALSLEGFWSRPGGAKNLTLFRGLTERELQDLPSVWHDAALRALQIGEWGGTPRIRTIQCVILFGQYIQISSSSGQHGRFLGWAASAIRVAQRMGLHRLGTNPETMPPDDPALPPGKNSIKRETAVRLFNMLVAMDSVLSDSSQFRCYLLHPSQYNTALPSNLNYSDLSRTEWRTISPSPLTVHTDGTFEIAQCHLAAKIRRALDNLVLSTLPFSYNRVLEQDREFRHVLDNLPDLFSERCPPLDSVKLRYQRALLHESVYARIVRLHRPFLSRGYNPTSQYRYSTEQCVRSARLIISSNYELLRITNSLWWMFTNTLGSAIVLFMDLFHAIDTDMSDSAIKEKKNVLVKASIIFNTQVASPALRAVVEQGRRILSGLFSAEEHRRLSRAAQTLLPSQSRPEVEGFGHILQRISQEVSLEEQQLAASGTTSHSHPVSSASSNHGVPVSTTALAQSQAQIQETYAPIQQATNTGIPGYEYWTVAGGQPQPPPQDFTSFFDTLASEDWTAAFATGSDSGESAGGLLGQMQATW